MVTDLKDRFARAKAVVLTDYKGLTVAEITELRTILKKSSLEYRVVKNTLARIAAQDTGMAAAAPAFKGPVGVAIGYDDPTLALKKVLEYAKGNEKLKVTGAVVEGKLCSTAEVKAIADLPSRDVLLAILAGVMQAPLSKLGGALNATVASFAYAMESLKNQKGN